MAMPCLALPATCQMHDEGKRQGESHRPMCPGSNEAPLIVDKVIKQVAACDQPAKDRHGDAAGYAMTFGSPASHDVHAPDQAECPQRGEGHERMQSQPPWLQRIFRAAEFTLALQEVMKQQPQRTA